MNIQKKARLYYEYKCEGKLAVLKGDIHARALISSHLEFRLIIDEASFFYTDARSLYRNLQFAPPIEI